MNPTEERFAVTRLGVDVVGSVIKGTAMSIGEST